MEQKIWYFRYRKDTKEYWGETDVPGDDPTCEYTLVEPIPFNLLNNQHLEFVDGAWVLIQGEQP